MLPPLGSEGNSGAVRNPSSFIQATLWLVAWAVWVTPGQAQSTSQAETGAGCADNITEEAGYKIRSVRVNARYLPGLPSPLPPPGATYSPALVTKIVEDVDQVLKQEAFREDEEGETELSLLRTVTLGKGVVKDAFGFGLRFVTSCTKVVDTAECKAALGEPDRRCADVTINAFSVRVDTANPAANLLNVPRSNGPTFLSNVPGPVLAFNPRFGIDHDVSFGTAGTVEIATNLLDISKDLQSLPLTPRRTRLDLQSRVRRSLSDPFYETVSKISLARDYPSGFGRVGIEAEFVANRSPLGQGEYLTKAAGVGANARWHTNFEALTEIALTSHYRWSTNRLGGHGVTSEAVTGHSLQGNAIIDGSLWNGMSRAGLWAEARSPVGGGQSYYRVAGLLGYQRDLLLVPNQSVGVEVLIGGGRAWGEVPVYSRFYGGNSGANFLYEAKGSPVLVAFPVGPLLRSVGSGRGGASPGPATAGGTSYWGVNLTVSAPVPSWSRPLVPDISIALPKKDAQGHAVLDGAGDAVMEDRPLRVIIKNQGETGRKVLERLLVKQGLSEAEAEAQAARDMKGINGILAFIADVANIYSLKPVLMLDAARVMASGAPDSRTRLGIGGGLQLTVVTARCEAGYVRTVHGAPGDSAGNFVFRLFIQDLF